jgi:hypothetical protein
MLNMVSRQMTEAGRHSREEIEDLFGELAVPAKPAGLRSAEARVARANEALTTKEKAFSALVRASTRGGFSQLPTEDVKRWNSEIEALRTDLRAAADARMAAREAFARPFCDALAGPNERVKVAIGDILDDLEAVVGRLVELNRFATGLQISPPRAVAASPTMMATIRQLRRLVGRAGG